MICDIVPRNCFGLRYKHLTSTSNARCVLGGGGGGGGGGEWAKIEFNYFCHCSSVVYLINKQSINGFGFSLYLCLQFCKFLLRLYCMLWVLCDSPGTREEGEIEQQPTDKLRGIQKVN